MNMHCCVFMCMCTSECEYILVSIWVYIHTDTCVSFLCDFTCMCVYVCLMFRARQQSYSSQGVQEGVQSFQLHDERLSNWDVAHIYTHISTVCVCNFCALSVSWYPGSFWHVINACDIRAQTEFSRIVLFSRWLQMKIGYFSKLILSLNSQSMPTVGRERWVCVLCCLWTELDLCFEGNYYKLSLK